MLPELIPILEGGLDSNDASQREGVCIGLTEIIRSCSRESVSEMPSNFSSGPGLLRRFSFCCKLVCLTPNDRKSFAPDLLKVLIYNLLYLKFKEVFSLIIHLKDLNLFLYFQISAFTSSLVPAVRRALCDPLPDVRAAASKTFDNLHTTLGNQVLDKVLHPMLELLSKFKLISTVCENVTDQRLCFSDRR